MKCQQEAELMTSITLLKFVERTNKTSTVQPKQNIKAAAKGKSEPTMAQS